MIKIDNKKDCCGCSVCASVCPKGCITMKQDAEGFYYPDVDMSVCINCGLCETRCPVINNKKENPFAQIGYVVQHKDRGILLESTSGGAFTGFAEHVIKKGGVVVGASLNKEMLVEHIVVDKAEDLYKFRNSKYVQSYISPEIYQRIKATLEKGTPVLFSGTACQIEGVKCFFGGKEYDNFYCIDVVCRAVPSPMIFKKYLEYQGSSHQAQIDSLRFRDKHFGYQFSTLKISFDGEKSIYHRGIESDPWLRAFFSGICNRPSCHECSFKKRYRVSDITIWDCFNYDSRYPTMKRNSGATNVLIHTQKGRELFNNVKDAFIVVEANPDDQTSRMKEMTVSVPQHKNREAFFSDANKLDGTSLFKKYFPIKVKNNILYLGRCFAIKTGVYAVIKSLVRIIK